MSSSSGSAGGSSGRGSSGRGRGAFLVQMLLKTKAEHSGEEPIEEERNPERVEAIPPPAEPVKLPTGGRGRGYLIGMLQQSKEQAVGAKETLPSSSSASGSSSSHSSESLSTLGRGRGAIISQYLKSRSSSSSDSGLASHPLSGSPVATQESSRSESGYSKSPITTSGAKHGSISPSEGSSKHGRAVDSSSHTALKVITETSFQEQSIDDRDTSKASTGAIRKQYPAQQEVEQAMAKVSVKDDCEFDQRGEPKVKVKPPKPIHQSLIEEPPKEFRGESGTAINIMANYIRLNVDAGRGVFEYEVRFKPDIDARGFRIKALSQHTSALGGTKTFDGVTLYLPCKLPEDETIFHSDDITNNSKIEVKVVFKKQRRMGEVLHLYNVLFKRVMGVLNLVKFGRQDFDPAAAMMVPQHKLEVWPGYVTAVDEYEGGIMLCLDISHKVLRQTTVLEFLKDLARQDRNNYKANFQKNLIGSSVLTRYNNQTHRIDDISFDMTPMSTFPLSGGRGEISFVDYYKNNYNLHIIDLNQPLLLSVSKRWIAGQEEPVENTVCIVPELCYLTGLTDENRNDFRLMKDIAQHTRITPNQRMFGFRKFVENVNNCPRAKDLLKSWGLSLSSNPIELKGRTLLPEMIQFGRNATCPGTEQAEWSRAATNNVVLEAIDLRNWIIIHTTRDNRQMSEFKDCIKRCGRPMGIEVNEPKIVALSNDRVDTYIAALKDNIRPNVQLIVCICPTSRDDRYAAIKKVCYAENAMASQVINSRTISNSDKLRSVCQKIALQINCKVGGSLWNVKIPLKNSMICGIDTYHDPTRQSKSVTALVASLSSGFNHWYSQVGFQGPREELSLSIQKCFRGALVKYNEVNGCFPDKVFVFRDGVGDGQLKLCESAEADMMQQCLSSMASINATLTFIVVQKRINTRVIASRSRDLSNPPPGTILDHTVTRRDWKDFFLVPQSVRQGTVSPTHYIVLKDTANVKPDVLQKLAFKMCHLYYNWPGTVRVPACCQYAHKLAYLVGQHVRQEPHPALNDKLFYL